MLALRGEGDRGLLPRCRPPRSSLLVVGVCTPGTTDTRRTDQEEELRA